MRLPENIESDLPAAAFSPLNSVVLRDWIDNRRGETPPLPESVRVIGEGPFTTEDFADFLIRHRMSVVFADETVRPTSEHLRFRWDEERQRLTLPEPRCVVLARTGWSEAELDNLLEHYRGGTAYFYSQEMFLLLLLIGRDAFRAGDEVLSQLSAGHDGLEHIARRWPRWTTGFYGPVTKVESTRLVEYPWETDRSPLGLLGYSVGRSSSLSERDRRGILAAAFLLPLPIVASTPNWGPDRSAARLTSIVSHLIYLNRNLRAKNDPRYSQAIEERESDIEWLREAFYQGRFSFGWPMDHG